MAPTPIRVGHANVLSRIAGVSHLASLGLDAFGTCETPKDVAIPGYVPFYGGEGHPDRRWNDTCAWRREDRTHVGVLGYRIARPSTPERIAGLPRFVSAQFFSGGGGLGVLGLWEIHPHYIGAQHNEPEVDRVAKVAAGLTQLSVLLDAFERNGVANIVVGDFNIPKAVKSKGWDDPWDVLRKLGFAIYDDHLDGAGVSPRLVMEDVEQIPAARLSSDHPGVVFTVREAPPAAPPTPVV